jgi:hypothetical protein
MTKLASILAALSLLTTAPLHAHATEYSPVTTGPWQCSKPWARAPSSQHTPRVVVTIGPWRPSKPWARPPANLDAPRVPVMTGPWVASNGR